MAVYAVGARSILDPGRSGVRSQVHVAESTPILLVASGIFLTFFDDFDEMKESEKLHVENL